MLERSGLPRRSYISMASRSRAARCCAESRRYAYVFYENGLALNVMCTIDDPKKRAVGFKLSEVMEMPAELGAKFKLARKKSKLAGTIRGPFFVIKGEFQSPCVLGRTPAGVFGPGSPLPVCDARDVRPGRR